MAVGFDSDSESEGGDHGFELPPAQDELIKQIATANKNLIVVVTSGGAVTYQVKIRKQSYKARSGRNALRRLLS